MSDAETARGWSNERLVAALLSDLYRCLDAGGLSHGRSVFSDLLEPALRLMDPYRPPGNVNEWPSRATLIREAKDRTMGDSDGSRTAPTAADSATPQGQCEILSGCGKPAVLRYPTRDGGYMHLCAVHGAPHARYCERWDGAQWLTGRGSDV